MDQIPSQYRPLGAWVHFGYRLLFSIPLLGFICLVIFSLDNSNINRRNLARSYFCGLVIVAVIVVVLLVSGIGLGFIAEILKQLQG